jgi:hypothetical protein
VAGGGSTPDQVGEQNGSKAANVNFNNGNVNWNNQSNDNNKRALPVRRSKWETLS